MRSCVTRIYLAFVLLASGVAQAEEWTLDRALETAQERSPTAERARATARAAELARWQAVSRLGPTAAVSASYTRYDEEVSAALPTGVDPTTGQPVAQEIVVTPLEQQALSLSVSMPLVDPAAWWGVAQASRSAASARAGRDDTLALLRLSVAGAYLDAVVADSRLAVAQGRLREAERRLARTHARAEVGKERRSAVLRVEADVLSARQQATAADADASVALQILSIWVGEAVAPPLAPIPSLEAAAVEGGLIDESPAVVAASERARAAAAARTQAAVAWLPRVDGRWTYAYSDVSTLQNDDGEYWVASITGSWTPFSTGARALDTLRAQSDLRVAQAAEEEAREATLRDLTRLSAEVGSTRALVEVATASVAAAERAAVETRADYEQGATLLVEVEAAEASLLVARSALVEAQAAAARAVLSWRRIAGRL